MQQRVAVLAAQLDLGVSAPVFLNVAGPPLKLHLQARTSIGQSLEQLREAAAKAVEHHSNKQLFECQEAQG